MRLVRALGPNTPLAGLLVGAAVLALTAPLSGCPKPPGSGTSELATGSGDASALITKADALWDERESEDRLKEALDAYEEALKLGGPDRHVLTRLTRGWYFWGDGFTSDKNLQIERWSKALEFGNQCIAMNRAIATARANGQKDKDTASLATAEDAPCLYWTATALGKWGKAKGISNTLAQLPTVKAYIARVEELDPTFYHYGPARYWGAFYAALPSFAGQDLDKSAKYFEAAIQGAPYYLPTRGLRAEMLAVATEDIKMFDDDIRFILAADPAAEPKVTAENRKEQEKARALLAKRYELFPRDVIDAAGPPPEVAPSGAVPEPGGVGAVPAPQPEAPGGAVPVPEPEPEKTGAVPQPEAPSGATPAPAPK